MLKRAVVVAHPDDEILWAGGLMIRYPGDWTVICCTVPRADPCRSLKFYDACEAVGARGHVIQKQELGANESIKCFEEVILDDFDHIVTHNAFGEYGHQHHKDVHRYVVRKYGKKIITTFGHRPGGEGAHKIKLTEFEAVRKLKALKCYNHVLPYNGKNMTKWEALIDRYVENGEMDFNVETFDGAIP